MATRYGNDVANVGNYGSGSGECLKKGFFFLRYTANTDAMQKDGETSNVSPAGFCWHGSFQDSPDQKPVQLQPW